MLENLMLASKFDNLCPQFAKGKSKRYSKKKIYYMVQYDYSFIVKHIMVIFYPLVSCEVRSLCNLLPYKEKTNSFFKNKECVGNNK